jgi:hypothetical protein
MKYIVIVLTLACIVKTVVTLDFLHRQQKDRIHISEPETAFTQETAAGEPGKHVAMTTIGSK